MLTDPLLLGAIDDRMIAVMRLMLALLALLSTYIDPAETTSYVVTTYTVSSGWLGPGLEDLDHDGFPFSGQRGTDRVWPRDPGAGEHGLPSTPRPVP